MQKGKSITIPLPKGQLLLILTLSFLLSAYLFTLIINYQQSREELKSAAVEQLRLEAENRASGLAFFFSDLNSTLSALVKTRELEAFFANKALKMSMRYGLGASLMDLDARFQRALQEETSLGLPVFSRILFVNPDGTRLSDTQVNPVDEQHNWSQYLSPRSQGPKLLSTSQNSLFLISHPYHFKGVFQGQLLAWVSRSALLKHFSSGEDTLPEAIYSWDGKLLAAGERWEEMVLIDSGAARTLPRLVHGDTHLFTTGSDGGQRDVIAMKVLLPGIDFYLVTLTVRNQIFSGETTQGLMFAVGVLPILATIGLVFFLHLRRVNATLLSRYRDSLQQRQNLAQEIDNRERAETRLRAKQRQLIQRSNELRQTMAALQESQQMLNEAQRIAHVGSWAHYHRSNKLVWSDEIFRILGLTPGQQQPSYEIAMDAVHPEDRERVAESYAALANADEQWEIVHRVIRRDGTTRVVQQRARYMPETAGSEPITIGVAYDITNRTLSEAEQARLQRELEQAQKMEALGQLTGGIAHDFNNSLGIILGYTSLARTIGIDGEPEKLDKYLAKVEMAGERTRKLIAQMLAFSRSGSSSAEPLYLEQLVREDIKLLRPTLPSSVEIRSRIASDLPPVEIEPVQVNQLLMNLSINARDAMNGSGVISYSLSLAKDLQAECSCCHRKVEGDWVELSVADTGSGIEAQHMNKLFEPFFTTKEVGKGTGMGLSVIHGIVSGCGGRILVESQVGKGARFRLLFPPVAGHEGAAAIEKEAMPSLAAGSGQHILIVDDEPALCSFLSELLQHQGYRTTVHSSSVRALKLLQQRSHGFDLLITDQTMPRITGLDLVSRARESNPDLPVILCSGYSEEIDSEGAAGLDISYLDKPVASGTLLEVVAGKLAAAESGSSERCAAAS